MSESMSELEKDIEESRARLDRTIDRIQDRLSPVNLVDEMLGSARRTPFVDDVYGNALETVRRNPLPVLLIAAGVGMLFSKIARGSRAGGVDRRLPVPLDGPAPVTPPERAYDPDRPSARPARGLAGGEKA